jgi:hypothetical protein
MFSIQFPRQDAPRDNSVLTPDCTINFLDFPREIRDRIYECILTEPNLILSTCKKDASTPLFRAASSRNRNVYDLNIFRGNKQVFHEARKIFFSHNTFDINLIEEMGTLRYNFVPTEWDYAITALRHIKVCVHLRSSSTDISATLNGKNQATKKLKYILERATDLRSLELWLQTEYTPKQQYYIDDNQISNALACVKNLQRLKLVASVGVYPELVYPIPNFLQTLRSRMLANAPRVQNNPVWAAYDSRGKSYALAMCHDDHLGNSLLSRVEWRYFQRDEVHEFKGEKLGNLELVIRLRG